MLLPPQFQTEAPAPLGAKITAMPAPPKPPHVHQWVPVPDSKVHSRCAECGSVTLTEAVTPKVIGFDWAAGPDQWAILVRPTPLADAFIKAMTHKLYAGILGTIPAPATKPPATKPPVTGQWIEHTGTTCPVVPSTQVRVSTRHGPVHGKFSASGLAWGLGVITKYMVCEPE